MLGALGRKVTEFDTVDKGVGVGNWMDGEARLINRVQRARTDSSSEFLDNSIIRHHHLHLVVIVGGSERLAAVVDSITASY